VCAAVSSKRKASCEVEVNITCLVAGLVSGY
jgi:hypothetical protein